MKRAWIRIIGIGIFHMVLYLYVVPFIIYPKFGDQGYKFAVIVAVLVSVAVLGSLVLTRRRTKKMEK